ncbi:MAG: hypothetical protein R3C32_09195 [Chloroflexota bacterium]
MGVNGVAFYVLLFATGQWQRLVLHASGRHPERDLGRHPVRVAGLPANQGWVAYNSLQQLAYFFTVFVAAPLAILTGFMQSLMIAGRYRRAGRSSTARRPGRSTTWC